METTAPIQKAKTIAEIPKGPPKRSPIDRTSLASPKPRALPFDISQPKPKREKSIGPINQSRVLPPAKKREIKANEIEM